VIEQKLSAAQRRVFAALSQQRQEAMEMLQEIQEAQQEQLEMLRQQYGLPEADYRLKQKPDGSVVMYAESPDQDEATDAS
jgi:uncharacterized membrane protein